MLTIPLSTLFHKQLLVPELTIDPKAPNIPSTLLIHRKSTFEKPCVTPPARSLIECSISLFSVGENINRAIKLT